MKPIYIGVLNCLEVDNEFLYYLPFPYKYIRPNVINKGCQLNSRFGFSVHAKPFLKWPIHIPIKTTAIKPDI